MLAGLLWTMLAAVCLIITMLMIPVDVMARIDLGARAHGSLHVDWLFGLVRVRRETGAGGSKPSEKPKTRKKTRRPRKPSPAVIRRGFGLLRDLVGRVHIRHAYLDLSLGTDDPAATGELAGFAAPVVALANALPRTHVAFTPDFSGPALGGAGEGEIRVVPISLIPPLVGFVVSPEVRRWLLARN